MPVFVQLSVAVRVTTGLITLWKLDQQEAFLGTQKIQVSTAFRFPLPEGLSHGPDSGHGGHEKRGSTHVGILKQHHSFAPFIPFRPFWVLLLKSA
jgi:hypothetical protein